MTQHHDDPALFLTLMTSLVERNAAPNICGESLSRNAVVLLRDGCLTDPSTWAEVFEFDEGVAALDLRALLEERERMRKALEVIATRVRTAQVPEDPNADPQHNFRLLALISAVVRAALNPKAQEPGT